MPDFDAITVALAARFAPAQVTPPAGYTNIRASTGNLPNQMKALPHVLVFPQSGEFAEMKTGLRENSNHEFAVRCYYHQTGDLARDTVALRKWLTVLVAQLRLSVQLGGIVTAARVATWSMGVFTYANSEYTGIELIVRVNINEAWAAVAA